MRRIACFCLLACLLMTALVVPSCICSRPLDPDAIRGLPLETLREMREAILARNADGSALSSRETADVELLREQERRLENAWVFGEWRERHGTRLIFRDDGSVSVGARGGVYDEWGVYRFISPEEPAFESTWSVGYDEAGDPIIIRGARNAYFLYSRMDLVSLNSLFMDPEPLSRSERAPFFQDCF